MVLLSSLKLIKKLDRSTENVITFPGPEENPSAFPLTIKTTVFLMNSLTLKSLCAQTIYGKRFQQLFCHSSTLMINTLCPIRTRNHQITNLEQTHIRCFLHCQQWTVKRRDCVSALNFFNEITYRTDEWRKKLLRLKSWVISRNPDQLMEFRRLWWTVFVFKCSYLLQLFDFYCLLEQNLLFSKK